MATEPIFQISYTDIVTECADSSGIIHIEKLIQPLEDKWLSTYRKMCSHVPSVMQFPDQGFTFLYDVASVNSNDVDDRLVVAYGRSTSNEHNRDNSRIAGFLGGGLNITGKGKFDKGHALAHAMGGGLDANLFPQKPELNRGRSEAGRIYRRMERYAANHQGVFVFSRLIYSDNSWVPSSLEYGVLMEDGKFWVECFDNWY